MQTSSAGVGASFDGFVGSDPGLNRFRAALMMLLTVGLALAGESEFLHLTHALQIGSHAAPPATVARVNHEALVVGLLLGGIFGMLSCFGVMDRTARAQRSPTPHKQADLAIRDLRAIDETMADMAMALHLNVTDYDTHVVAATLPTTSSIEDSPASRR